MVTAIQTYAPGLIYVIPNIRSTDHFDSWARVFRTSGLTGLVSMAFSGVRFLNKLAICSYNARRGSRRHGFDYLLYMLANREYEIICHLLIMPSIHRFSLKFSLPRLKSFVPSSVYLKHPTPLPAWCEYRVWLGWCSACEHGDKLWIHTSNYQVANCIPASSIGSRNGCSATNFMTDFKIIFHMLLEFVDYVKPVLSLSW